MADDIGINQAKEAIGSGQQDDYILEPTKHADELKNKAPDLATILTTSELSVITRQFEEKDQTALTAQKEFRGIFNRANRMVLFTAICTALVLATGVTSSLIPAGIEKIILICLSIASIITGALASKDLYTIRQGKLLEAWMTRRALAESTRLEYFNTVASSDAAAASANGIPVDLLKLEYFRRFQLDVQLAFFTKRADDHRREARKTLSLSSWSMAGAAIATGLAGVLTILDAQFAAIATLGAVFGALSSFATIREQIYQSQRISERYSVTADTLLNLYKRLDAVRKAVLAAGRAPLLSFIEAVHDVLSLELKQWLGEQNDSQGALAKLEETLKQATAQSEKHLEAAK